MIITTLSFVEFLVTGSKKQKTKKNVRTKKNCIFVFCTKKNTSKCKIKKHNIQNSIQGTTIISQVKILEKKIMKLIQKKNYNKQMKNFSSITMQYQFGRYKVHMSWERFSCLSMSLIVSLIVLFCLIENLIMN